MKEKAQHLLMAALDGELSPQEKGEFDRLLVQDPQARRDFERFRKMRDLTRELTLARPPDEIWETYWVSVYNRLERGVGWILFSIGAILLAGYGAWVALRSAFLDPTIPLVLKIGLGALAAGFLILAASVAREKLAANRDDPYKDLPR